MLCEHIWTGREPAVGWLVAEDVGWSPEPAGCLFINQVGTVNENTDISPACLHFERSHCAVFMCGAAGRAGSRSTIHDGFCNSLRGFVCMGQKKHN